MMKLLAWLLWRTYYIFRPAPRSLEDYLTRSMRTRWPWWTFQSSVWHNDDGGMWEVCFTDERSFSTRRTMKVDCHIGFESGDIVGFNVWDETLRATKESEEATA